MRQPTNGAHPVSRALFALGILVLCVVLTVAAGLVPAVRFTNEIITVHAAPAELRVDAIYYYENPYRFPVRQGLSIPFPRGPEPVEIRLHRGAEPVPMRFLFGRYCFELPFRARERVELRLRYRQFAPERQGEYLLTTTQPWRRPLVHGRYVIKEEGVTITRSSYELKRLAADRMEFSRTNFTPHREWEFAWEVR